MKEKTQQYIPKDAEVKFCDNTAIFEISTSEIKKVASDLRGNKNLSLKLITATDERAENGCFKIWYVFGVPQENIFIVPFIQLKNTTEFPSLSLNIFEALNYERKIQTFFGLTPIGCRDSRPIILHENWPTDVFPLRKDFSCQTRPKTASGSYRFQKVKGEGIYEIPVGPIHAGIIEPGHFRFSVAGERIVLLEPRLGFTHKGSEKLLEVLSLNDKVKLSEKISGDSSFSHSLVFCQALEKLSDINVPERTRYLRVIYAEMERLANHFGDIGAIMMDTGFNFGGAQGARLREIVMQINERITGSRFLRGVNVISGVTKDIDNREKSKLSLELENLSKDFSEVIAVAVNSTSLLNRLKGTGTLSAKIAKKHGVVGVAGKAVGMSNDARFDYPYAAYDKLLLGEVATEQDGDVYARFRVRIKETHASINIIQDALNKLPEGGINIPNIDVIFKKNAFVISVVEGWRGEIVYFITTDAAGNISRVAPRDPSFINWAVLRYAGFDNVIPDFPLINKSFNLSYTGNDL
ncbi:MAG: NADH-quinone oxidoreductase subunit C [Patescibacteria group bacterium]|nr:NADH-quinone oxidoreductase subunit C [Patescibacteria group bacterium]